MLIRSCVQSTKIRPKCRKTIRENLGATRHLMTRHVMTPDRMSIKICWWVQNVLKLPGKLTPVAITHDIWPKCLQTSYWNAPNLQKVVLKLRVYHRNIAKLLPSPPEGRRTTKRGLCKVNSSIGDRNDVKIDRWSAPSKRKSPKDNLRCEQRISLGLQRPKWRSPIRSIRICFCNRHWTTVSGKLCKDKTIKATNILYRHTAMHVQNATKQCRPKTSYLAFWQDDVTPSHCRVPVYRSKWPGHVT